MSSELALVQCTAEMTFGQLWQGTWRWIDALEFTHKLIESLVDKLPCLTAVPTPIVFVADVGYKIYEDMAV